MPGHPITLPGDDNSSANGNISRFLLPVDNAEADDTFIDFDTSPQVRPAHWCLLPAKAAIGKQTTT